MVEDILDPLTQGNMNWASSLVAGLLVVDNEDPNFLGNISVVQDLKVLGNENLYFLDSIWEYQELWAEDNEDPNFLGNILVELLKKEVSK